MAKQIRPGPGIVNVTKPEEGVPKTPPDVPKSEESVTQTPPDVTKPDEGKENLTPTLPDPNPYVTDKTVDDSSGLPLSQEAIGERIPQKIAIGERDTPLGLFGKAFRDKYGISKHYLKFKAPQKETFDPITNLEIMVYEDGTECSYFENLSESEINSYELFEIENSDIKKRED